MSLRGRPGPSHESDSDCRSPPQSAAARVPTDSEPGASGRRGRRESLAVTVTASIIIMSPAGDSNFNEAQAAGSARCQCPRRSL